jgi:hypothetical protein
LPGSFVFKDAQFTVLSYSQMSRDRDLSIAQIPPRSTSYFFFSPYSIENVDNRCDILQM